MIYSHLPPNQYRTPHTEYSARPLGQCLITAHFEPVCTNWGTRPLFFKQLHSTS